MPPAAQAQVVDGPNPLAGVKLYSDPQSPAMKSWRYLQRKGRTKQADLIWKIAGQPRAVWVGRFTRPRFHFKVRRIIDSAKAQGSVPVMAVLRAESTSCGPTYTAGGRAADRRVRKWYRGLARAIGGDRVVIAFEPDSVGTIDCLARSRRDDRIKLLRYGVDVLSQLPNATIYLEAWRLRLGGPVPDSAQAAQDRHRQGARLHAERHPLRLDPRQRPPRT